MRLILLVVLLLGMIPRTALATDPPGYPWRQETVPVYDYTTAMWDGFVEGAVKKANHLIPGNRFVYIDKPPADCDDLEAVTYAVVVCSQTEWVWYAGYAWWNYDWITTGKRKHKVTTQYMRWSFVQLSDVNFVDWPGVHREAIACHEVIMHGILGVLHTYGYDYMTSEESCIHAWATHPGTWDRQAADDAYGVSALHRSAKRVRGEPRDSPTRGRSRPVRVYDPMPERH
jgi:hypothetical protein